MEVTFIVLQFLEVLSEVDHLSGNKKRSLEEEGAPDQKAIGG